MNREQRRRAARSLNEWRRLMLADPHLSDDTKSVLLEKSKDAYPVVSPTGQIEWFIEVEEGE